MKKVTLLIATLIISATGLKAATGFFDGLYIKLDVGGGETFYQLVSGTSNIPGTTPGPGAAGAGHSLTWDTGTTILPSSLGTFQTTDTLVLEGFEYKTFENDSSDVLSGNLFYRVYEVGQTPGGHTQLAQNTPIDVSGNNNTWRLEGQDINLLSGLNPTAETTYRLEFYTDSGTNNNNTDATIFGFTGGDPFVDFTVVPEPSTYALLAGLVGFFYVALRRRSA